MSCELSGGRIDAYVDDELPERELADFEAHLRACPSCAADALARLRLKRMTQAAASRYSAPPEFRLKIEKAIQKKRRPLWPLGWMPALAVAALVLIAVSGVLWMRYSAREQAFAELLDLHVATLASANPVDVISTDRHTVKPWFQGKLPFTFNLPELQDSPFKLLGGRLMYLSHSPGAQLLFELRKHQISVFIVQSQPGIIPLQVGATTARERGFSVEAFTESGLRYVIVGDTNPADIHQLSELLRAAAKP
jgi:anti-sigma factor RsiW